MPHPDSIEAEQDRGGSLTEHRQTFQIGDERGGRP